MPGEATENVELDGQSLVKSLTRQVSEKANEVAVRDAIIDHYQAQLKAARDEIMELRRLLDELALNISKEDASGTEESSAQDDGKAPAPDQAGERRKK